MCLIVCMHEHDYIIVIILSMMKLLGVWVPVAARVWGRDKLGIRALGSLVSSHKNESSRVLRNGRGTPLLFFERL